MEIIMSETIHQVFTNISIQVNTEVLRNKTECPGLFIDISLNKKVAVLD